MVQRADHPVARFISYIERVDAARGLRKMAEKGTAPAGDRVRQQRAIDATVQHEQYRVPRAIVAQVLQWRQHAIKQLADSLAAQKRRRLRHDAIENAEKRALDILSRQVAQPAAANFLPLRPDVDVDLLTGFGQHALRRLDRAWQAAGDDLIEADLLRLELASRCARFLAATVIERHAFRVDGAAAGIEVSHVTMAHQEDAAAFGEFVRGRHL